MKRISILKIFITISINIISIVLINVYLLNQDTSRSLTSAQTLANDYTATWKITKCRTAKYGADLPYPIGPAAWQVTYQDNNGNITNIENWEVPIGKWQQNNDNATFNTLDATNLVCQQSPLDYNKGGTQTAGMYGWASSSDHSIVSGYSYPIEWTITEINNRYTASWTQQKCRTANFGSKEIPIGPAEWQVIYSNGATNLSTETWLVSNWKNISTVNNYSIKTGSICNTGVSSYDSSKTQGAGLYGWLISSDHSATSGYSYPTSWSITQTAPTPASYTGTVNRTKCRTAHFNGQTDIDIGPAEWTVEYKNPISLVQIYKEKWTVPNNGWRNVAGTVNSSQDNANSPCNETPSSYLKDNIQPCGVYGWCRSSDHSLVSGYSQPISWSVEKTQ